MRTFGEWRKHHIESIAYIGAVSTRWDGAYEGEEANSRDLDVKRGIVWPRPMVLLRYSIDCSRMGGYRGYGLIEHPPHGRYREMSQGTIRVPSDADIVRKEIICWKEQRLASRYSACAGS